MAHGARAPSPGTSFTAATTRPIRTLRTWRSRLLRTTERNATHAQVNRDLLDEFAGLLAAADWDVALLQECPAALGRHRCRGCHRAEPHRVLTSRNSLAGSARRSPALNPDLIASNEGGSNLTLVRGEIVERRELELAPRALSRSAG